jgi:protein-S-isoprenylcysteine O-methyltransferase Ste14
MRPLLKNVVMGIVLITILLLVSGRMDWWRAWLYAGTVTGIWSVSTVLIERTNPGLLAERSRVRGGTKSWDKVLVAIVGLVGPLSMWCVSALDVRWHWPPAVPWWWSAIGFAGCGAGSLIILRAMMTNRFFSATVRIQHDRGHQVCDSGPYGYIRHPGYTGVLVFTLASPVALGSWEAEIPALITAGVLALRTALEDRTLRAELTGYAEYTTRVRWRLVPGLW